MGRFTDWLKPASPLEDIIRVIQAQNIRIDKLVEIVTEQQRLIESLEGRLFKLEREHYPTYGANE